MPFKFCRGKGKSSSLRRQEAMSLMSYHQQVIRESRLKGEDTFPFLASQLSFFSFWESQTTKPHIFQVTSYPKLFPKAYLLHLCTNKAESQAKIHFFHLAAFLDRINELLPTPRLSCGIIFI